MTKIIDILRERLNDFGFTDTDLNKEFDGKKLLDTLLLSSGMRYSPKDAYSMEGNILIKAVREHTSYVTSMLEQSSDSTSTPMVISYLKEHYDWKLNLYELDNYSSDDNRECEQISIAYAHAEFLYVNNLPIEFLNKVTLHYLKEGITNEQLSTMLLYTTLHYEDWLTYVNLDIPFDNLYTIANDCNGKDFRTFAELALDAHTEVGYEMQVTRFIQH